MGVVGVYKEEEKSKKVYFNLDDYNDENVVLELVDEHGYYINGGYILYINKPTGKIYPAWNINRDIGFDLDKYGKVKVEVE